MTRGASSARRAWRTAGALAAALVVSAPLSVALTLVLMPFWRWLEATRGIEAVGHSGPAEWCYAATFAVVFAVAGLVGVRGARSRSGDRRGDESPG